MTNTRCDWKWGGFPDGSTGIYNAQDVEGAKALIEQADATGRVVGVLVGDDNPRLWRLAEISLQTLELLGFAVTTRSYNYLSQQRILKGDFTVYWSVIHHPVSSRFEGQMPLANTSIQKGYGHNYQDATGEMTKLMNQFARAGSGEEQLALVKAMQLVFWRDVPYIPLGDSLTFAGKRKDIVGMQAFGSSINVYNAWRD